MAASRQRELDIPGGVAALGQSAVDATRKGLYVTSDGEEVVWRDAVQKLERFSRRQLECEYLLPSSLPPVSFGGGSSMRRGRANLEVDKNRKSRSSPRYAQ
jgi:hypothetical protein